jgi:hypothetical protein
MSIGAFRNHVDLCWEILSQVGLAAIRNVPPPHYPDGLAAKFRNLSYIEEWEFCITNQLFDIRLNDHALFQFRLDSINPINHSFSYYEAPKAALSVDDYIRENLYESASRYDPDIQQLFEEYWLDLPVKKTVTPIRYDCNEQIYTAGSHPRSHVHFGYRNNIRVGTARILNPVCFTLFIIRQCYPAIWLELLKMKQMTQWCTHVRDQLERIEKGWTDEEDVHELILH